MSRERSILVAVLFVAVASVASGYALAAVEHSDGDAVWTAHSGQTTYHGNIDSKIFHKPSCRYYECKKCTKVFRSTDAAKKAGYRACKVCKP